jgi:Domain of unknown function (DUF5069)
MTRKIFPRSPYLILGGYVHLPRLIDKARLHRKGLLQGYNYKTLGFDKHLLSFLGIDGDTFEEIANTLETDEAILERIQSIGLSRSETEISVWNQVQIDKRPNNPEKLARFRRILQEVGGTAESGVETYFELIEFEERREEFYLRKRAALASVPSRIQW